MAIIEALGPCDWPVVYASCSTVRDYLEKEGRDPKQAEHFEKMAAELLWQWTGQVFGLCEMSARPHREGCDRPSTYTAAPTSWSLIGSYRPSCGACLSTICSCDETMSVSLPGPVSSITRVVIDGKALPASTYRIDNKRFLVRLDGKAWPARQDITKPTTEEGTWEVIFQRGLPVPDGGQIAAGVLALELAKAACSDRDCALPQRVQSVTRQGVSMTVLDEFEDVQDGKTGIWLIDSWVASIRHPKRPSTVHSPDIRRTHG